jgi:hypothetical protein
MPVLVKVKNDFMNNTSQCRLLYNHCLSVAGPTSEPSIEAAFLQLFKSWEYFLEESFISYLSGRLCCDGNSIQCYIKTSDEDIARRILFQESKFSDWTSVEKVVRRYDVFFFSPNRCTDSIKANSSILKQVAIIRNSIAHISQKSKKEFYELCTNLLGGRPSISRPSQLLSRTHPSDPSITFFDWYVTHLEVIAARITG